MPAKHFRAKRAYLSQMGCFFGLARSLSEPDKLVFRTNGATAVVSGKAFSGKTSLSEPDRVFFWTGKAFSGKTSLSEPDKVFFWTRVF